MKKSLLNVFVLGFLFSVSASAEPAECAKLAGSYAALADGYPGWEPTLLEVAYDARSNQLTLKYGQDGDGRFRSENYIPDGDLHFGDYRWTGHRYSVNCYADGMRVVKDFSVQFPNMILTGEFKLEGSMLTETLSLPSGYSRLQGRYLRIR